MKDILTTIGEEFYTEHDMSAVTVTVLVYNDGSHGNGDNLGKGSDVGDITTEPGNNYGRPSVALSPASINGHRGVDNDSEHIFDFADVTSEQWIDTYGVLATFTSDVAGDSSDTQHLVATVGMTTDRDIGSVDDVILAAGDLELYVGK